MIRIKDPSVGSSRFPRFLVAGGFNTLFGFLVYSFAIVFGASVWIALTASLAAGIVFNFFSTGWYAFRDLALSRWPRIHT